MSVGQQRIAYEALVDSGADYSIFHAQIGEALGLDIRRGSRVTFAGVGGVAQEGFRHRIELDIQQQRFASHVVFAPGLKIPYGILGQEDLFERFVIVFDHKHGWLDLKPRP
ncbi:MAG: retropepsin-like domain-containing protein [Candidatus Omnitrophica bacterium]|nr:retropepsin-like domain-containing protein [Candidatus Omnitrophota bacterium]